MFPLMLEYYLSFPRISWLYTYITLPPSSCIAEEKYNLQLPEYPGVSQVVARRIFLENIGLLRMDVPLEVRINGL